MMKTSAVNAALFFMLVLLFAVEAGAAGNISTTDKYAWSETSGWLNFGATGGAAMVYDDHLEGYAWQENIGWVKLGSHTTGGAFSYTNSGPGNWGVNRSNSALSGYAWSDTSGWINFAPTNGGVTVDSQTGIMDGWAWAENIGWIHFRNSSAGYGIQYAPTFGVSAIVIDETASQKLYAGQDGAGIWRSTNSAGTWIKATTQPSNQRVKGLVMHPTNHDMLYAATYGGGIFQSVDSADIWTSCGTAGLGSLNSTALAIDPTGKLYAGTEAGIFTSAGCASWGPTDSSLPASSSTPPVTVVIDPVTSTNIYTGLDGAGVYKSTNSGNTWTVATTQPTNLNVRALVIKPGDSTKLFAATYGGGVFKTANGGDTWTACSTAVLNLNVVSLTIDANGKLYAGTEAGVFVSENNCDSWTAMNNGLPN